MIFFILSAFIVLIDRGVKLWIAKTLEVGQALPFIPGVLRITHVENTGAAFSIFSNMRWPLVIISSVAVIVLIFVILLYRDGETGRLGAAFMMGGAVGNLIDRAVMGKVIDMFEPEFMNFAVFNVADIFVTVGCLIFILHLIHLMIKMRGKKKVPSEIEESAEVRQVRRAEAPEPATPISAHGAAASQTEAPEIAVSSPYSTGAPMDTDKELTEQQILMEYYMEQGIDKSEL